MSESEAIADLRKRGVWRLAPGLWCDASMPDLIVVVPELDTASCVRAALEQAGQLPERKE